MTNTPAFNLEWRDINGAEGGSILRLPANHLVTHAAIFGMTGSGKSGLVTVIIEEALSAGVPTIVIDVYLQPSSAAPHDGTRIPRARAMRSALPFLWFCASWDAIRTQPRAVSTCFSACSPSGA